MVTDGSEIKLQSPEQHWKEVFGTEFGTVANKESLDHVGKVQVHLPHHY